MLNLPGPLAFALLQSSSIDSPVLLLILALAIVGAATDWKYHKTGGKPSSHSDRILFWVVALLVAGAITWAEYTGWDPRGILGFTIVLLVAWFFLAWEIGRWRMRRKYPLSKTAS
jgi:hypothetical protein